MILFKEAIRLAEHVQELKNNGKKIGFVPTMGALHAGHISLVDYAVDNCDITVSSIFINPTQFNDPKDFEKYPVTIAADIHQLENANCDILFLPSVNEIYPNGTTNSQPYALGEIENLLEGKYRPGHFQGVCQVVHRLLDIVKPDLLFMGQKDYQQCMVVERLIQLVGLPVEMLTVPTSREESGLALSSRNTRLTPEQKKDAEAISKVLFYIQENYRNQPITQLLNHSSELLLKSGFYKIDYVSIVDGDTLLEVEDATQAKKLVALVAAFIGEVRLIDNVVLTQ